MTNISPDDKPYSRVHRGTNAGSCEAKSGCLKVVEGTIKSKQSGKTIRACREHIEEFLAERQKTKAELLGQTLVPRPPSIASQIRACTTPVEVHKLMGDLLKSEASSGTRRKWHRIAEKKIQSLKGGILVRP